jgi:hypothetical protein
MSAEEIIQRGAIVLDLYVRRERLLLNAVENLVL